MGFGYMQVVCTSYYPCRVQTAASIEGFTQFGHRRTGGGFRERTLPNSVRGVLVAACCPIPPKAYWWQPCERTIPNSAKGVLMAALQEDFAQFGQRHTGGRGLVIQISDRDMGGGVRGWDRGVYTGRAAGGIVQGVGVAQRWVGRCLHVRGVLV